MMEPYAVFEDVTPNKKKNKISSDMRPVPDLKSNRISVHINNFCDLPKTVGIGNNSEICICNESFTSLQLSN